MGQSRSREADIISDCQEIPTFVEPETSSSYSQHPSLEYILRQFNSAHNFTPYFFEIYFIIILLPASKSPIHVSRSKILYVFLIPLCILYIPSPYFM